MNLKLKLKLEGIVINDQPIMSAEIAIEQKLNGLFHMLVTRNMNGETTIGELSMLGSWHEALSTAFADIHAHISMEWKRMQAQE